MASAARPLGEILECPRGAWQVPAVALDGAHGKALRPPTEFLALQGCWGARMDDPASFEPCPAFEGTLAAAGSGPARCFALPTVAASS